MSLDKHYDFIVFEFVHSLKHHKKDLFMIAKMLKYGGFNVAILDVFDEYEEKQLDGIEVIRIPHTCTVPDDKYLDTPKGKIYNFLHFCKYIYQQYIYMHEVLCQIKDLADAFYCGSYSYLMPANFFDMEKPIFFWGLRSYFFNSRRTHMAPYFDCMKFYLKWKFKRNANNKLFVSNEMIKKEHLILGINSERMVIREERCIEKIPNSNLSFLDKQFNLLVIGKLRDSKRVVETINAFKKANLNKSLLTLMGKSMLDYEHEIVEAIGDANNIIRKNQFLNECDFNTSYMKSHFVVFGDKKETYTITNGTFLEALINMRPVIAPNYDPYKYYIEKYHVGILYDPNIKGALSEAFCKAKEVGMQSFLPAIHSFLQTLRFEIVADEFSKSIRNTISKDNKYE